MDKRELQNRTKQFALRVLKLIDLLPRTAASRKSAMDTSNIKPQTSYILS
jgi:hypothetical protein